MASDFDKLPDALKSAAADVFRNAAQRIRSVLSLVANEATTKFMIQTSANQRSKLTRPDVPVDPERLTWRTGALALSIQRGDPGADLPRVELDGERLVGVVGTTKPYAAIHEFGGRTAAHTIRARQAKALHFVLDGKDVFAKSVNHPGSVIPARPFLRPAIEDPEVKAQATFQIAGGAARDVATVLKAILGGEA